jgi:hypothetical protein
MKAERIINMIKGKTDEYGVTVSWQDTKVTKNSRRVTTTENTGEIKSFKVLLLKEKFNLLQVIDSNSIGLTQDYARYILTLPDIPILKDLIITDNHNKKWKLGIVDWFDIGGVAVLKQSALTEVS